MRTLIKICGVTSVGDALLVADEGAQMIGMIFWANSKRFVSIEKAKEISLAAKSAGARPVGVFVDQEPEEIREICHQVDIDTIQLHGSKVKCHLAVLSKHLNCFFVVSVSTQGVIDQGENWELAKNEAEFLLFDHAQGGTGQPFCWDRFLPPTCSKWMLAGGINPENVQQALKLKPIGIDVCSGVERPGTATKDPQSIKRIIEKVREADEKKS